MRFVAVTIDRAACLGNQMCIGEAPGVFHLDSEGRATLLRRDFDENDLPQLESAEAMCPTGAIKVEIIERSPER